MVAPTRLEVAGAPRGFNGQIAHSTMGSIYVRVGAIQRNVSINTSESAASQAKTMYPLYVSQGSTTLRILHKSHAERGDFNAWVRAFMEASSAAELTENYVDVKVPVRRFERRAVIQGTLEYGASYDDGMLTTMLVLTGAADPVRRYAQRSRMLLARNDALVSTQFYPAGVQAGWDPTEQVYDRPDPIRPGMPDRPV